MIDKYFEILWKLCTSLWTDAAVVMAGSLQLEFVLKMLRVIHAAAAAAAAKSLQSCLTLCDPMDCSLPSFSVHGILQASTLEWVAISFSNA